MLGMALVGTIETLVLGFLTTSAKTCRMIVNATSLTQMSAKVVLMGRLLQHYGPEAGAAHEKSLRERLSGSFWSAHWAGRASGERPNLAGNSAHRGTLQKAVEADWSQRRPRNLMQC